VAALVAKGITHLMTPGFNMVPLKDTDLDWRTHVYARPNKIWYGKSALYRGAGEDLRVSQGGQHYLKTQPPMAIVTCPRRTTSCIVSPLEPKDFPIYYLHFTFYGCPAYLQRIQTMLMTPWNARQMVCRYGKGLVDQERIASQHPNEQDIACLQAFVSVDGHEQRELYRQAVRGSLISACEVRTDIAEFFGLAEPGQVWDKATHKEAMAHWGVTPEQIQRHAFPPKTTAQPTS
jgi:hypothetical protein